MTKNRLFCQKKLNAKIEKNRGNLKYDIVPGKPEKSIISSIMESIAFLEWPRILP